MIDRVTPDMSLCSRAIDGWRGNFAEREAVQDPGRDTGVKPLFDRALRSRLENGAVPGSPRFELIDRRQRMGGECLRDHTWPHGPYPTTGDRQPLNAQFCHSIKPEPIGADKVWDAKHSAGTSDHAYRPFSS